MQLHSDTPQSVPHLSISTAQGCAGRSVIISRLLAAARADNIRNPESLGFFERNLP
jgi:hypothetical protein